MSARAIVSLIKATTYEPQEIQDALKACLAPLGGMEAFVRPGQRVLLKPNLLGAFPVDRAVTTHPALVRAAILSVQEAGGLACLGDSPGMTDLPTAIRLCGLEPVLNETGAELVDFSEPQEFEVPEYRIARTLKLGKNLHGFDVVISLCKLKTHMQMTHTGALKNQFGLVPGTMKGQWHFRLQEPAWLASLMLDVNRVVRPSLAIMDAVIAMEGQGPAAGKPRSLGALLASRDLAALDTISCQLIALEPMAVPLLRAAREQQFGITDPAQIAVAGADWRDLRLADFKNVLQPRSPMRLVPLPKPALLWIRRQWTLRPRILKDRCTQCGICEAGCPVAPPVIHPKAATNHQLEDPRCIRCYCCHEFCPSHAIALQRPWLGRCLPVDLLARQARRLLSAALRVW